MATVNTCEEAEIRMEAHPSKEIDGRQRVIIERVTPEIDAGRFAIKRVIGEEVCVEADIFCDGHEMLSALLKFRHSTEENWQESPLAPLVNDRWRGSFVVTELGEYFYTIEAWVNHFRSWRRDLEKKFKAGQDVAVEILRGVELVEAATDRASGSARTTLASTLELLAPDNPLPLPAKIAAVLDENLAALIDAHSDRSESTSFPRQLKVSVDPEHARFSAWYEIFPRSCAPEPKSHGTLRDCAALMPRIAGLGFDIVYLPPIHPIGHSFRKGKNGTLKSVPDDPGSPWAIGSEDGGHKSIHPKLGNLADFRALVAAAEANNLRIALDIALQCSPDHPYVKEHPTWFKHRADGSIQYAENPPKKYQDIYPLDFESADWKALWVELKSIFEFWIEQGVYVFRVDNPHTKTFGFWEWCLGELKAKHPDLVFLSEAFTRPKLMYYLAKIGFTQSYNYFPWRNTSSDLRTYLTELTTSDVKEFFRPNLWPNTPDILTEFLQFGGRPAFMSRLILAATLGASYGVYGPPYERLENEPREPGSEEYLNSEKFEIRHWDFKAPGGLGELMGHINRIRRENPALQFNDTLLFHDTDNPQLIAYSKHSQDGQNIILVIVNLDPHHIQRGWVTLNLAPWGISPRDTYQCHELLTNARYLWSGARNYVELNPVFVPAHVFRVRRYVRTEYQFDYFL